MPKVQSAVYLLFILSLFCLIGSHASALDYSVPGDLDYLTADSLLRGNTGISGDNTVWVEMAGYYETLCLYNIKTDKKTIVSKSRYTEFLPSISGEYLVWGAKTGYNSPSQVVLYNISSGSYEYASYYPANQGMADVSGDYIVWLDGRYLGYTNIYLKNIRTGGEGLFWESKTSDKKSPQVGGDYIYWIEKGSLYKRSLYGGEPVILEENFDSDFSVSDGVIVWEEKTGNYYSVVIFDQVLNKKTILSGDECDLRDPFISGDIVVYENLQNGDSDIFLYDLTLKTAASVCIKDGDQVNPQIFGDAIIWTDKEYGRSNIVSFIVDKTAKPDVSLSTGASVTDGLAPLVVYFTGASTITPGYSPDFVWDFGDGTTSTEDAPVHTYMIPGTYNVSLTVSNNFGTDVITKENCITVGELPAVDFTAKGTTGVLPYTTRFHEVSFGDIDSRIWDFGDGTGSVLKNPYHIFEDAGFYTVSLTLKNIYGKVIETKENFVDVGGAPDAAFVYSYDGAGAGNLHPVVSFTDVSSGNPDAWLWYFGDGTFSTEQNPVHTYEKPGIYDVSLKVENRYAEDIKTEWGTIQSDVSQYPLVEMFIVPNEAGFMPGDTMQFVAAAKDSSGQSRLINPKWSVANTTVAEIDGFGTLTAKNTGATEVFSEYMGISAAASIVVGTENYARSGELPALVMTDMPEGLSEETKKLISIFYRGSD